MKNLRHWKSSHLWVEFEDRPEDFYNTKWNVWLQSLPQGFKPAITARYKEYD